MGSRALQGKDMKSDRPVFILTICFKFIIWLKTLLHTPGKLLFTMKIIIHKFYVSYMFYIY